MTNLPRQLRNFILLHKSKLNLLLFLIGWVSLWTQLSLAQTPYITGENIEKSVYENRSLYGTNSIKFKPSFRATNGFQAQVGIPIDSLIDGEYETLELADIKPKNITLKQKQP